jgi:hypothetical protein
MLHSVLAIDLSPAEPPGSASDEARELASAAHDGFAQVEMKNLLLSQI